MITSQIEVSTAGESERESWEAFVATAPGAEIGHRWRYHEVLADVFGLRTYPLVARRGGRYAGVLPLVLQRSFVGRFLTSVPYLNYAGVLSGDPEARRALGAEAVALAARLGVHRLEVRGRDGADLPIPAFSGKASYVLELPAEAGLLWDSLSTKLRTRIRRPRKNGYTAAVVDRGGLAPFYAIVSRRWHELGSPAPPERFFAALGDAFGDDVIHVVAEKDGAPVAAAFLLRCGASIEVPWAGSRVEHDREGVNMLLYWTLFETAIARGAARFDFGRSTPGSGTASFKLQWGAAERPLGWNVHAPSARGRSSERGDRQRELVASVWKRLPGFVVRRVGPVLAARIPL